MSEPFIDPEERELKGATPEQVEILYSAGILTYGELLQFADEPIELIRTLEEMVAESGSIIPLPSPEDVSEWIIQANNELPGTIITKPDL